MKQTTETTKTETTTKLNILNSNHIKFKYDKLNFEILGGVNQDNYQSLSVMLLTKYNRYTHRGNVDLLNHDQRIAYLTKVSESTHLHRDKVILAFEALVDELEEYKLELRNNHNMPLNKSYQLLEADRDEAIELLKKPKLLNTINTMIGEAGVIGNDNNRMVLFLTYLTRKTNKSLHSVIQSQFNYLQNKMGQLIPEEERVMISHISDNAIFYFNEVELQNKVVLVEDTVSNRKSLLPLIGFQNNNLVTKTTVTKNEFAELVTVQKHVKGNVSLSISTREEQAFTQNGALSFVINEETGNTQDEKVLLYQRKQSAGLVSAYNEQQVIEQIQNIQRALSCITVINPFAMEIELPEQIKSKQITNLHYLRFIEIITFLKQYQRTRKVNMDTGEEYIETTVEDIKEANQLLSEILVNKSDVLNKPTRLFLEQLKSLLATGKIESEAFTLLEVSMALKTPKTSIRRYAKVLIETGFLSTTGQGDRNQVFKYQLINVNEFTELKASINQAMNKSISSIEKTLADTNFKPKTKAKQNESGTGKILKSSTVLEVHQNILVGIGANNKNALTERRK